MSESHILATAERVGLGRACNFTLSGDRLRNTSDGKTYFAKHASNVKQLLGEAEGLRRMFEAAPGLVPRLHVAEQTDDSRQAVFISGYVDLSRTTATSLQTLAKRMASELHNPDKHRAKVDRFGFPIPTHCGVTEQDNTWEDDWMVFFRDHRIGDLLNQLERRRGTSGTAGQVIDLGRQIQQKVIPKLLTDFEPPAKPVLLHGDLWSGNVAVNSETGEPVVYDCSSYYGHNEADFGISRMFGPFDSAFYSTYHSILPRSQPHYEERQQLYELYHHLNHYLMFGGSYASGATSLMRKLLQWSDCL